MEQNPISKTMTHDDRVLGSSNPTPSSSPATVPQDTAPSTNLTDQNPTSRTRTHDVRVLENSNPAPSSPPEIPMIKVLSTKSLTNHKREDIETAVTTTKHPTLADNMYASSPLRMSAQSHQSPNSEKSSKENLPSIQPIDNDYFLLKSDLNRQDDCFLARTPSTHPPT